MITSTPCLVKPVLCVGNAVVDCISVVDNFPQEDSEQIGVQYYWQRGGNATNNCTVLSQLRVPCEFMGVLTTKGPESKWLLDDFHQATIPIDHCVTTPGQCPLAVCIVSQGTGSRTILAYPRNCPELTRAQFKDEMKGDFSQYSWVHFELRSQTAEVVAMMKDVNIFNRSKRIEDDEGSAVIVSVEVENPTFLHPEQVMCEADFVFISKEFALSRGYTDIHQALEKLYVHCRPGSVLICAWGERGAGARWNTQMFVSPAKTGVTVVDSLGAGDTFTAGFIYSILHNNSIINNINTQPVSADPSLKIERALEYGCQLAGYKCGIRGYQGLQGFNN